MSDESKQRSLKVNLTDEEMKKIRIAAAADDMSMGDFIRRVCLDAAEEVLVNLNFPSKPRKPQK